MLALARLSMLLRSSSTSIPMASRDAADIDPVFMPWIVSALTLCTCSTTDWRRLSVCMSQLWPSVMLRECWRAAFWSWRTSIALLVPVGESDAVLICLPDVSCCCSFVTAERFVLSPSSAVCATARWVMRIRSPPHDAGAVDEGVQRLVDRGHHAGGGAVGVLEGQHVGHLLVEVDTGGGFAGGIHLGGDHRLHLQVPRRHRRLHTQGDHELAIVGVHTAAAGTELREGVGVPAVRGHLAVQVSPAQRCRGELLGAGDAHRDVAGIDVRDREGR